MREAFLEQTNFSLAKSVLKLGIREKRAVKTILVGLYESQETGREQKPIKITITPDNPFRIADFAEAMSEIGMKIFNPLVQSQDSTGTTITFQPKPYGNSDFLKGVLASRQATDHFIANFLDYEPLTINSKSVKNNS